MRMIAALLALLVVGCDGITTVRGNVTDSAGKPLTGAKVSLVEKIEEPGGLSAARGETADSGAFDISATHAPRRTDLVLIVLKEGYKPYREEIVSGGQLDVARQIVLVPEAR